MITSLLRRTSAPAVLLAGALLGGAVTGIAMADYSRPAAALSELNAAKVQLTAATPDKGGHRDNAITYMNYAIAEIEAEIQAQGQ